MTSKNLLVELLVEELPPKVLKHLGEIFANKLWNNLIQFGLADKYPSLGAKHFASPRNHFASPRRLAAFIPDVLSHAIDRSVSEKLMSASVGLDASGNASPQLLKKLSALGLDANAVTKLRCENDGKTEVLYFDRVERGATLSEGLERAIKGALAAMPIPKVMTYQLADGWSSVQFVRPAHGLVALHGSDVVPVSVLGLQAGRTTQGHRFEAASAMLEIRDADSYESQMETEGAVIPSFEKRRAEIAQQIAAVAAKENLKPITDEALLDEVTGLVERPNVLLGQFEKEFLAVPQECLILTMKANQKYFPLLDSNGKLSNKFLIVSNIRPADASLVVGGNERVVRPRLADAKFFFDQDRKKTLASRLDGLNKVVYHNKLGSQGERVERVRAIAKAIGQQLGGDALAAQADQAAMLAKADLLTDMVGEFPELQGIMGRYYAQHDGLSNDIAFAIEDHYKPRFAGDELPRNEVGICVALADKLETLVGMFGIGQIPTGDKDPFALRRHALGIARMLIEKELPLSLDDLLPQTMSLFGGKITDASIQIKGFIYERVKFYLSDESVREQQEHNIKYVQTDIADGSLRGAFTPLQIDAVLSIAPQYLSGVHKRLDAVRAFARLPESAALAAANKRVRNILKKVEGVVSGEVKAALLQEPAEQALHQALINIAPKANAAFAAGDYTTSLQALAALKEPVDAFFDNVMVNAEDMALRANRLALLAQLHQAMNCVADISKLAA